MFLFLWIISSNILYLKTFINFQSKISHLFREKIPLSFGNEHSNIRTSSSRIKQFLVRIDPCNLFHFWNYCHCLGILRIKRICMNSFRHQSKNVASMHDNVLYSMEVCRHLLLPLQLFAQNIFKNSLSFKLETLFNKTYSFLVDNHGSAELPHKIRKLLRLQISSWIFYFRWFISRNLLKITWGNFYMNLYYIGCVFEWIVICFSQSNNVYSRLIHARMANFFWF